MNFIITLLILILILGIIIFVHEFGHFISAKIIGVHIDEFSIGMGPVIWKHISKKSKIKYSLRAFPIGGFVSMAEKEDPENKINKNEVLEHKSFLGQLWVFLNGIIFNCLLAIVVFFISGLLYGQPISEARIGEVTEDGIAYKTGIESGDLIVEVNGVSINNLDEFLLEVSAKKIKEVYTFVVEKEDGSKEEYNLIPKIVEEDGVKSPKFGIIFSGTVHEKGFVNSLKYAFNGFWDTTSTIFKILGSLFTGQVSVKNLSGPVGIYSIIDQVKSQGLEVLLYLLAYLSINVGIINLIPVPVFDGGRVLLLIIEKITKHKLSDKAELMINYIGFGIMILLVIYVTFNDIIKLVSG